MNCSLSCQSISLYPHSAVMHKHLIHSSALSSSTLHNFLNCSSFIVSLNCGQNFADRVSNSPLRVPLTCFSASVILSMQFNPFLPNQFFTMAILSCSCTLYVASMVFTSRMKAFHSEYLSATSQLNCGCFSTGLPSLGPHWYSAILDCISAIVWIVILVASATAFMIAIASLISTCSAIFAFFLTYVRLLRLILGVP